MTPPITVPSPSRASSFTKPSLTPIIFARGFAASGSLCTTPLMSPAAMSVSCQPTVAISGAVKMFAVMRRWSIGITTSPRAWKIAVRPCIEATEASGTNVVQSPAA